MHQIEPLAQQAASDSEEVRFSFLRGVAGTTVVVGDESCLQNVLLISARSKMPVIAGLQPIEGSHCYIFTQKMPNILIKMLSI